MGFLFGSRRFADLALKRNRISVLYSKSNCPFENLAFEDYVYEKISFSRDEKLLFLWRNKPTIVIGRHQNTWNEINVRLADIEQVSICRRKSGGGAVYHDLGNLNLTFFTNRSDYNRKENLNFIITTLNKMNNINLSLNTKDDILLNDRFKVSGTAAKLGLKTAYHHCTLLCNTNLKSLSGLLKRSFGDIETNATQSVRSDTANIFDIDYSFSELCEWFCLQYENLHYQGIKLQAVNPLEFPTVLKRVKELKSWEWIYGKSPKFCVPHAITLKDSLPYKLLFTVDKGLITDVKVQSEQENAYVSDVNTIVQNLIGVKFRKKDILSVLDATLSSSSNSHKCKKQISSWVF